MSVKENVWTEIKNILTNDATLSIYNKAVYEGLREEDVSLTKFPCIVLEPNSETESINTVPYRVMMTFSVTITGIMLVVDINKQIIGDSTTDSSKGILDFSDDIKNALWSYPNLNYGGTNTCIKFKFPMTNYVYDILNGYPYRATIITMDIDIEFNKTSR